MTIGNSHGFCFVETTVFYFVVSSFLGACINKHKTTCSFASYFSGLHAGVPIAVTLTIDQSHSRGWLDYTSSLAEESVVPVSLLKLSPIANHLSNEEFWLNSINPLWSIFYTIGIDFSSLCINSNNLINFFTAKTDFLIVGRKYPVRATIAVNFKTMVVQSTIDITVNSDMTLNVVLKWCTFKVRQSDVFAIYLGYNVTFFAICSVYDYITRSGFVGSPTIETIVLKRSNPNWVILKLEYFAIVDSELSSEVLDSHVANINLRGDISKDIICHLSSKLLVDGNHLFNVNCYNVVSER